MLVLLFCITLLVFCGSLCVLLWLCICFWSFCVGLFLDLLGVSVSVCGVFPCTTSYFTQRPGLGAPDWYIQWLHSLQHMCVSASGDLIPDLVFGEFPLQTHNPVNLQPRPTALSDSEVSSVNRNCTNIFTHVWPGVSWCFLWFSWFISVKQEVTVTTATVTRGEAGVICRPKGTLQHYETEMMRCVRTRFPFHVSDCKAHENRNISFLQHNHLFILWTILSTCCRRHVICPQLFIQWLKINPKVKTEDPVCVSRRINDVTNIIQLLTLEYYWINIQTNNRRQRSRRDKLRISTCFSKTTATWFYSDLQDVGGNLFL